MKRGWTRAGFALFGVGFALIIADRANPPDMTRAEALSPEVAARDGTLLRAFLSKDGAWRIHTTPRDVSPRYLLLLKAYEDRRFDSHPGVDLLALGRAASQWLGAGHVVSGGSTLTMQVARLLEPDSFMVARPNADGRASPDLLGRRSSQHRGVFTKAVQAIRALQLEERYSKDEILSLYLTLAPMGGNLEGVRAASLSYFGKEPAALDLAESALLVALPQSPVRARPDRHAQGALAARNHVLDRMVAEGVITAADAAVAKKEGVPFARQPMPLAAPHLAQRLVLIHKEPRIVTTINSAIQAAAERLAAQERGYFDDGADLALVVVENKSRNLVATVGGTRYWGRGGQVDLATRGRSPGSALKPFIYGLAFDTLALHPLTRMTDEASLFGDYAPQDFEGSFQGTVTAREALQMSLNIPAVALLDRVGPLSFTMTLQNAGAHLAFPPGGAAPSLPVALGGLGISLSDIAMLYAGIAEGGQARALRVIADSPDAPEHRLFGPVAAWYLRDVLDGVALPDGWAMGQGLLRSRSIGFKTGTSYGFRDAWAVGFSNDYTVAVWVGRADGSPRPGHMGREAGAPILLKMFGLLPPDRRPAPAPPAGAILARSTDELPPALQVFHRDARPEAVATMLPPPAIAFPPNGAVVPLPGAKDKEQTITLKADGGRAPLTWLVNGELVGNFDRFAAATYHPGGEGLARVTVVDADGRSDTSEIRFKKLR